MVRQPLFLTIFARFLLASEACVIPFVDLSIKLVCQHMHLMNPQAVQAHFDRYGTPGMSTVSILSTV